MGLLDWLLRRKPKGRSLASRRRGSETEQIKATKAVVESVSLGEGPAAGRFPKLADSSPEVLTRTANSATVAKDGPVPAVNIWDMEAEADPAPLAVQPVNPARRDVSTAPEGESRRRSSRSKTRVLGFEPQPAAVVPLFDEGRMEDEGHIHSSAKMVMYPVGWLAIAKGPGQGAVFALPAGISQIGRGVDQTVSLDFGDMAISRQNHASVVYDGSLHRFHIGHGGKSNLVRLNGKPLLSTEMLSDGDEIQIGETTLMLKVLCTPAFNWSSSEAGGDGHDMAIA